MVKLSKNKKQKKERTKNDYTETNVVPGKQEKYKISA